MSADVTTSGPREIGRLRALRRGLPYVLVFFVLLVLFAPASRGDDRSIEVLRYHCSSEFSRREITLFKNGTVRLRDGPWENQVMYLAEIGPDAVRDKVRVLAEAHAVDAIDQIHEPFVSGVTGQWTQRCEIHLALPGLEPFIYRYSAFDVPPLKVARLVAIAEELVQHVEGPEASLPGGYLPRRGDVLKTAAGRQFRVLRRTDDKMGVELEGVDQPLRIYVSLQNLRQAFEALVERGDVPLFLEDDGGR